MNPRILATALAIFSLVCMLTGAAVAAESINGTIEKAGNGKITLKDGAGTVHNYEVDSAAKITLDGKTVKLDELSVGASATVATEVKNNKTMAVTITAKSKL